MLLIFLISRISSIQYCITTNISNTCDCHNITEVYPDQFNEETILNESIVDLYFCTDFNQKLNLSAINRRFTINSFNRTQLLLNLTQISNAISLSFHNVNILVENSNSQTLNVNSLYLFQSNFRQANSQKFSLLSQRFTTTYEGYLEFESVITDYLRLLQYDIWLHQDNPTIDILPNNAQNQHIEIEMMNDCYIDFQNYSVTFINKFNFTINVKYKARIDLYVTGTQYVFFSSYYIHGDNFIPVNIFNFITIPDRIKLRLNYTGFYGVSIPQDRYMTVSQFPNTITVEGHIQSHGIPLSFNLYQNSILILDVNSSSIQGSVIASYPNGQITTNILDRAYFEAYSIERLGGTYGTIQCSPQIDFVLERFTNHAFISGQRNTISFKNLDVSPGFNYHTNLAEKPNVDVNIMIGDSGVSYNLIEGSFSFPAGEKHLRLTFDSSITKDVYFYRYIKNDSIPILCNRLKFECNEWSIDSKTNTQNYDENFPFSVTKNCFYNSPLSLYCLSIQIDQPGAVDRMKQDIYIGNNVVNRPYNTLLSDETQFISSILDHSVNVFNIRVGVQTTVDLRLFRPHSTLIIRGIDMQNSNLNLIVSDQNSNIPLHILVIDTCSVTFNGTYIQADKIVIHNCQITNLTVNLNTNDLCVPLNLFLSNQIREKKFPLLTIFTNSNSIEMNYTENSVLINSVEIGNNNFDTLWIYPIIGNNILVNYNLIGNSTSVKGISLNFSNYNVDNYYIIEKPIQSRNVIFNFFGKWDNVTNLINPFRFDLSGVTTIIPQIPKIFGLDVEFSGGNIEFRSTEQISIQNHLYMNQNLIINAQTDNLLFSQIDIDRNINFVSGKKVTIQSLTVDRDISVSLNPISSMINSLTMNAGSQLNSQAELQVNTLNFYFDIEKIPFINANPLLISQINLNFLNSSNSNPSNFIGIRNRIICGSNLSCSNLNGIIRFNSNVNGVSSNQINNFYKRNCTDPDSNRRICMYVYLDEDINSILYPSPRNTKKKSKAWIIAVAVLVPILVILLIIGIITLIVWLRYKKKQKENKSASESSKVSAKEEEEPAPQSPRKKKIQAPIPPRSSVRWNPRRGRLVYQNSEINVPNKSSDENKNEKNKNVADESQNENESNNQLSPTQKSKEKLQYSQDPENNSYQSDDTSGSDYF